MALAGCEDSPSSRDAHCDQPHGGDGELAPYIREKKGLGLYGPIAPVSVPAPRHCPFESVWGYHAYVKLERFAYSWPPSTGSVDMRRLESVADA